MGQAVTKTRAVLKKDPATWSPQDRALFYSSRDWSSASRRCKELAGYVCSLCSSSLGLESHHIRRPEDGGSLLDQSNLMCLCGTCHRRTTHINKRHRTTVKVTHDTNICQDCKDGFVWTGSTHVLAWLA